MFTNRNKRWRNPPLPSYITSILVLIVETILGERGIYVIRSEIIGGRLLNPDPNHFNSQFMDGKKRIKHLPSNVYEIDCSKMITCWQVHHNREADPTPDFSHWLNTFVVLHPTLYCFAICHQQLLLHQPKIPSALHLLFWLLFVNKIHT